MGDKSKQARGLGTFPILIAIASLVAVGVGVVLVPKEAWSGLLIAGVLGLYIALGAGLFAAISVVSGAQWWNGLRPIVHWTALCGIVPAMVLGLTFVLGMGSLYPWAQPGAVDASHLLHAKAAWLNRPFFLGRALLLLILFTVATRALLNRKEQVSVGGAAAYIVLIGLGISVASWDWLMSLEPEWFSTMFGVYGFAGAFLGGIAAIIMVAISVERWCPGTFRMSTAQCHDLGKLLFGFSMFWAYIWFCQYMLIWYSNIPEESVHFAARKHGIWLGLFWLNPIVSFVAPFLLLLSSHAKKNRLVLGQVASLILVGRWLDVYLMVMPATSDHAVFPWLSIAATLAVFLFAVHWGLKGPRFSWDNAQTTP